ncbi:uncharacterized protein B0I36DRAFT_257344 [Microdochium trichocladiopsis]|uniref:C2H2-type domain-containing protein n=1 Tax=Microdochium trichocladiopsis TaxID=1682393 RepID=A0A9P9BHF0_9PEZI|nr:uncharacterized protein B0I36DRAFT_257344 [Microdochium trichocladiopsis]KAH7010651.1 hypothetical protein B0I36DRAFT_257344 [Microdochium trichocladiopsis]
MAIRYEADGGRTGGKVGLLSWPAADASSSQEHRVLLCVSCRVGIRPDDGIRLHFWRTHRVKGEALRQIVDYSYAAEPIANPHTVPLPTDGSPQIEQLLAIDGFSCSDCRFLTTSRKLIRVHRSQAGHDHTTSCRGSNSGWNEVRLQTLSPRSYARYWVVEQGHAGTASLDAAGSTSTSSQHILNERLASYEARLATELAEVRRTVAIIRAVGSPSCASLRL